MSVILAILVACLPPWNSALRNVFTISIARPFPTTLSPIVNILASLCSLVACALKVSEHKAALIPGTLFAAIPIPIPVPHINIPKSNSLAATAAATGNEFYD